VFLLLLYVATARWGYVVLGIAAFIAGGGLLYAAFGHVRTREEALAWLAEAREVRANRLAEISYDEVLGEYAVFGTPEAVADRLLALREEMGFSTLSTWMNPGGQIPNERVLRSMRRFAERAAPR